MSSALEVSGKTKTGGLDFKVAAAICYVPFFAINIIAPLVFYFTEPQDSKLVRFHALQSLLWSLAQVPLGIGLGVLAAIIQVVAGIIDNAVGTAPILTLISSLCVMLVMGLWILGIFGFAILGAVKGFQGQVFRIPVVGQIADKMTG